MPFLLAEILDFQGSAHLIGVGSLRMLHIWEHFKPIGGSFPHMETSKYGGKDRR